MRVLLITNYFPPHYLGGAEVVVYNTCHGLLQRGVDASVLMVNARMRRAGDVHRQVQDVPLHEVTFEPHWAASPWLQVFDPRVYRQVRAEVRRLRPDLVHVHNLSGATLAPLVACRRLNVPVLLTLHDQWLLCPNNLLYRGDGRSCDPAQRPADCAACYRRYDFWAAVPRRRERFAALTRHVRFFLSPSQKLIDLHVAAGYDPARFRVLPNGIEPGRFQLPSSPLTRACVDGSDRFRTMLFAGALIEVKGVPTLLEALPLLTRHIERFRLVVAGAGDEPLRAALRRYDPATVWLLGPLPFQEMRTLYAAADLTVVPSLSYENAPMTIAESLMAGTPVLGSAIGGIPELVREGETGYLFPPGDAAALAAQAIRHFARPARRRREMRRRCADFARAHLTLDRYLERLLALYAEALEG